MVDGLNPSPHDRVRRWAITERDDYRLRGLTLAPNALIVDIGAHRGIFTVWAHSQFPHVRIHAYELDAENYRDLHRFTSGLPMVTAHHAAVVGEKVPTGYNKNVSSGCHHVAFGRAPMCPLPDVVTLAEIVAEHGDVAMMKMDCEGSEHFILETASEDGSLSHVGSIALEYHNFFEHTGEGLAKLLRKHYSQVETHVTNSKCGLMYASNPR